MTPRRFQYQKKYFLNILARTLAVIFLTTFSMPSQADGYPAKKLFVTGQTIVGEEISYPNKGKAQINASIVTLEPGEATIRHGHGVPLFAFILEGELTVDYGVLGKTFRKGQAIMEAMEAHHKGINTGGKTVKILAVYMGAEGAKNVTPSAP
jgi:quercetin dioxygenase-like cupin family protein